MHWSALAIDPQCLEILRQIEEKNKRAAPIREVPVQIVREKLHKFWSSYASPRVELSVVEDIKINGSQGEIPVRIYRNRPINDKSPAIIYFHGGAHCYLSIDTYDNLCRSLCLQSEMVLVAVDYRLAPEFPFPAGITDCVDATNWIHQNADDLGILKNKIALVGDSAGANMAIQVSAHLRSQKEFAPRVQLLIYPNTDLSMSMPSHDEFDGIILHREELKFFYEQYLAAGSNPRDPAISPLWIKDKTGFPDTHIITAEFDPLRDEAEAFAKGLENAGVSVTCKRYDGMIHGFLSMAGVVKRGSAALSDIARLLKTKLTT